MKQTKIRPYCLKLPQKGQKGENLNSKQIFITTKDKKRERLSG